MDYANLIAAMEGGGQDGLTGGFNFLGPDGKEEHFSWERLKAEAKNRAAHFRALGMKKGDRLALVMPDGIDFVPTFLGASYAGVIPVPLYPPLSLGKLDSYIEGLVAIMNRAEPTHLATSSKSEQMLWRR